jgi:iron complex transport system substrate-binding protein
LTEALFAIGLGDRVVGVSNFCKFPAQVEKLPRVGTYLAPNAEAIARLAPDLVVLERSTSQLTERLHTLGIRYIHVPQRTLEDVYSGIRTIGEAGGLPDRAAALDVRLRSKLEAIRARAATLPSPRVLVIVDRRAGMLADLTVVGNDNYLQELLQIAGGTNVMAKPGLPPYPRIALETVLREDPEVVIDLSGHAGTEAERQTRSEQIVRLWSEQAQLRAVRSGRVIVEVSDALIVPGPRAPLAAQILFDDLHGVANGRAG